MELLLALAAVIVAATSLVLAYVFSRRFSDYGRRLAQAERMADDLRAEHDRNADRAYQAERRAAEQDWVAKEQAAAISRRVSQLSDLVTETLADHGSRLDALGQAPQAPAARPRCGSGRSSSAARRGASSGGSS